MSLGGDIIGRRTYLKALGAGTLFASALSAPVAAHGGDSAVSGGVVPLGSGRASAYVSRSRGRLSAIGVRFSASALQTVSQTTPEVYNLALPRGDTGRFQHVTVDWNPQGHPPSPLFTHPHFDFHFYLVDEETVAGVQGGEPTYQIPDDLMPADTSVTDPREADPEMGEHLLSVPASVPAAPGQDGWSVYIWGADDPDGDGVGELTFMEPMVTVEYLEGLEAAGGEESSPIPMPERFSEGGWYPTEYLVQYHDEDDTYTVSLESFQHSPGYGRR